VGVIGPLEIVVIIAAIAIFFFGKDKVIEWAKSLGQAKKAFQEGGKEKEKVKAKPKKK